jgi:hypothetical protein
MRYGHCFLVKGVVSLYGMMLFLIVLNDALLSTIDELQWR